MPEFSMFWITIPVGLGMFGILIWTLRKNKPGALSKKDKDQPLLLDYAEGIVSFLHKFPVHAPGLGRGEGQLARILVTGNRIDPVEDVQVKVVSISPSDHGVGGLPFYLHRMNDNVFPFQRSAVFSQNQEEYFDVAQYGKHILDTGQLEFCRIDRVSGVFHQYPCTIEILITGKGIRGQKRSYRIWIDDNNDLRMVNVQCHETNS